MKLTEKDVRYVATLANLNLTEAEVLQMVRNLGEILAHMDRLSEIDTAGVQPMAQVLYNAPETAALREDTPRTPLSNEAALANAPMTGPGYFKVPLVIER
ncbi:MAG: Asp-tRNA(Asn)/Glu-tRNA(Gln) amidotransferase subunit GatC [Acidobacteriota bacterium]|nr:Asp-tRNA(Asn)/Glu-tRNA(Gln) amidotransferase subunit GatC [Acidobacteriota bacterium]